MCPLCCVNDERDIRKHSFSENTSRLGDLRELVPLQVAVLPEEVLVNVGHAIIPRPWRHRVQQRVVRRERGDVVAFVVPHVRLEGHLVVLVVARALAGVPHGVARDLVVFGRGHAFTRHAAGGPFPVRYRLHEILLRVVLLTF